MASDLDDDLVCLKNRYRSVCFQLSVDDQISNQAWSDYTQLSERYSLEGDQLHWLCCLLYLESRNAESCQKPSLTGLLKSSGLEPHRFFELCKRQISSPTIGKLELSHQVGIVLAVKFPLVFEVVFDQNFEDFGVFKNFAWLLFCWARLQKFSDPSDLVHGFHLMLACHELLFQSALTAGLVDAIHPELESSSTVDVLCMLCDKFQVNSGEARSVFMYGLEPEIKELGENLILQLPLLDYITFNTKSISRLYDNILSQEDHLDERTSDEPVYLSDLTKSTKSILDRFLVNYQEAEIKLNACLPTNWRIKLDKTLFPIYGEMVDFANGRKLTIITLGQLLFADELTNCTELEQLLFSTSLTRALFECCIRLINYWQGQCEIEWSGSVVPAFYAYSVIQPVVRALLNIGLCRDAARHLLSVEEVMLESKVFDEDSPLWTRIQNQTLPSSAEVCEDHSISVRTYHDEEAPIVDKEPQSSLTLIMSKIYLLAATRIDELCCEHLEQREIVGRRCWYLIEHILQKDLVFLKNRHIDQVIMCTIYAMTKAAGQPLSFQKIMKQYRKMGKAQIYKKVSMNGEDFSDIIAFYNQVFVPKYKSVICTFLRERLTTGKDHDLPDLPGRKIDKHLMDSPLKLSPRYSVYLSPRKPVCRSNILMSYTYQSSPHKDFSKLNAAMDVHASRKRKVPLEEQDDLQTISKKRCDLEPNESRKRRCASPELGSSPKIYRR